MTTPAQSPRRTIATLKLPRSVPALIVHARRIVEAMTDNPAFPSPTPPLATVSEAIQKLQAAQSATLSRTKGAVTVRDEVRHVLARQLEQLKSHVQMMADASIETSASIVQSAGIGVRKTPVQPPRVFAAKRGAVSGSVTLVTRVAARRAAYHWQYSTDAGKTWVAAPSTLQARTSISGLSPGVTAAFRYRPMTKNGEGDWSEPNSLIVT